MNWNSIYKVMPENGQQVLIKVEGTDWIKIAVFEIYKPASVGSINCEFRNENKEILPALFWLEMPSLPKEEVTYER